MNTIAIRHDIALEPKRPAPVQGSLHWLILALLIIIIASWYFDLNRATFPGSPETTPIHRLYNSCGGVATPC